MCHIASVLLLLLLLHPLASSDVVRADGGFYTGAFSKGQPAGGPGVFTFANGNKQGGKWIEQKEEGAEDDALPKLVWISDVDASI